MYPFRGHLFFYRKHGEKHVEITKNPRNISVILTVLLAVASIDTLRRYWYNFLRCTMEYE